MLAIGFQWKRFRECLVFLSTYMNNLLRTIVYLARAVRNTPMRKMLGVLKILINVVGPGVPSWTFMSTHSLRHSISDSVHVTVASCLPLSTYAISGLGKTF